MENSLRPTIESVLRNYPLDNFKHQDRNTGVNLMEQVLIPGEDIRLPLVTQVGFVHSHSVNPVPWHSHDGFELIFVLDGTTAYEFKVGRPVEVPGGHFLVIPPRAVHRGAFDVRMPSTICGLVLDSETRKRWRNTPFTGPDLQWMAGHFKQAASTVHPFNRELKHVIARLTNEKQAFKMNLTDPIVQATFRSLTCAAVLEAARQLTIRRAPGPTELVAAAAAYLRQHYQEPIQMPDLVRHLGFSRSRMFQLFKAGLGLGPNDYLQRVRIEKAQELLRQTRKSVTQIALDTGFNSSQYFSTVFRRYTGHTPARYREKGSV
jgi:AraC-like DNA-binding protein/mannose-6-phosphate isomerase-like protein (cupin superfamily)